MLNHFYLVVLLMFSYRYSFLYVKQDCVSVIRSVFVRKNKIKFVADTTCCRCNFSNWNVFKMKNSSLDIENSLKRQYAPNGKAIKIFKRGSTRMICKRKCPFDLFCNKFVDNVKQGFKRNQIGKLKSHQASEPQFIQHSDKDFRFLLSENELIRNFKSQFLQTDQHYEAVFILGPMGSGKTRVINKEFRLHEVYGKYVYVDTDEIMEQLNGFHEKLVDIYYPSARKIAIHLTDWLLDKGLSFIAEGTCVKYLELEDYMIRLKEKGYKVKVKRIPHISLELTLQRVRNRKGRFVSDEVVKKIYIESQIGLKKLFERNELGDFFEEIKDITPEP